MGKVVGHTYVEVTHSSIYLYEMKIDKYFERDQDVCGMKDTDNIGNNSIEDINRNKVKVVIGNFPQG